MWKLLLGLAPVFAFALDGPGRVLVRCGDVIVLIDGQRLWTPKGIEYKGVRIATEQSAYGTVAGFPGIGIIGSAHLDKGKEEVFEVQFFVDGKPLREPPEKIGCLSFRLFRKSKIRGLDLQGTVEIRDNRLYETARIHSGEETPLDFIYNFMHAWMTETSQYLGETVDGQTVEGDFPNGKEFNRQFFVNRETRWIAVYNKSIQTGAVSRLLERPDVGGAVTMLWNAPPAYRKFYLKSFANRTMPAGFTGTYRMVTGFFQASAAGWQEAARKVAAQLE